MVNISIAWETQINGTRTRPILPMLNETDQNENQSMAWFQIEHFIWQISADICA